MISRKNRRLIFLLALAFLAGSCSSSKTPPQVVPRQGEPPAPSLAPPPVQVEPTPSEEVKPEIQEQAPEEIPAEEKESVNEKEDASVLLEDAFNTYQDALAAWEKGDLDTALQTLDEAYGLLLKANLSPDSPLCQEKNDLRLLIAQRIQQIHASRLVTVGDNHKTIPLVENKDISDEIASFQTRERKAFEEAYARSGLYRDMILEELRREGLPEELVWMPMIESWFKVKALSRARALGMWQFISSTGYRFGLKRDRWVDERMDPLKSTRAAIRYLVELHSFFGDWTTALASYNCGEIRVQNVIRSQRIDYLDNFWDLYRQLPVETARYVPRFLAALHIINDPAKYGITLPQPLPSQAFETIRINQPFKLSALAAAIGADASELVFLNPELRQESTPGYEYELRVPPGTAEKALQAVNNLPRWIPPEAQYVWHYVRSGETLSTIAARYRTSVTAIARLNGLRSVHFIKPGQRLKIPGRGVRVASAAPSAGPIMSAQPGEAVTYKVRRGDTLYGIARRFAMSLDTFLILNGLTAEAKIYPGQEVRVVPKS
jgi:membrane-bound lytic murein transglycosylase D